MNRSGTIGLLLLITGMGYLCLHRESSPAGLARISIERDRPSQDVAGVPANPPQSLSEYDSYFIQVNDFRLPCPLIVQPAR